MFISYIYLFDISYHTQSRFTVSRARTQNKTAQHKVQQQIQIQLKKKEKLFTRLAGLYHIRRTQDQSVGVGGGVRVRVRVGVSGVERRLMSNSAPGRASRDAHASSLTFGVFQETSQFQPFSPYTLCSHIHTHCADRHTLQTHTHTHTSLH